MSVKHIGDLKKTECYGCSACVYSCPFGAITMEQDREGFRYPVVDEEKCTGWKMQKNLSIHLSKRYEQCSGTGKLCGMGGR